MLNFFKSTRGDPAGLIIGILIAVPSGVGVALAVTTGGINSLVGVAISGNSHLKFNQTNNS